MTAEVQKKTLVSIDDDPITLNSIRAILAPFYRVMPFTSGATALKFLQKQPAELILLDCNMPGMSGFEVMTQLQTCEINRSSPVIFLTGAEDGEIEVKALESGAADYIIKPVKPKVLLTRVKLQLDLRRYRENMEQLVQSKTRNIQSAYELLRRREDTTLNLLAKVTDMRDHGTGDHIRRTTEFVRILTDALMRVETPAPGYRLTTDEADNIVKSSRLHDLGKIAIPDHILLKFGKLTPEEFEQVKRHPLQGAQLLEEFDKSLEEDSFLTIARDIALYHHEKWNGSGYPTGRKGEDIPLSARIVAIADVYDALISVRPYKRAFSHEAAVQIITKDAGQHFDPILVAIFLEHQEEIRAAAECTGEAAAVR